MAITAAEYKSRALRVAETDKFLAERQQSFYERELPFLETDALKEAQQKKIDVERDRAEFLGRLMTAIEGVEA